MTTMEEIERLLASDPDSFWEEIWKLLKGKPNGFGFFGTYNQFIAYRCAVMLAIARAWADDQYYAFLKCNPKEALKFVGYTFPFDMDLEADPDNAEWLPDTVVDWHVTRRNTLRMVLPPAPPLEQQGEALVRFNANHITFLNR